MIEGFDGVYLVLDVKTLDPSGDTHRLASHTDVDRLAAHAHVERDCAKTARATSTAPSRLACALLS